MLLVKEMALNTKMLSILNSVITTIYHSRRSEVNASQILTHNQMIEANGCAILIKNSLVPGSSIRIFDIVDASFYIHTIGYCGLCRYNWRYMKALFINIKYHRRNIKFMS